MQKIDSLFVSETCKVGSEIPGIAIAVVNRKKVLWYKTIGYTDASKSNSIDPSTISSQWVKRSQQLLY